MTFLLGMKLCAFIDAVAQNVCPFSEHEVIFSVTFHPNPNLLSYCGEVRVQQLNINYHSGITTSSNHTLYF